MTLHFFLVLGTASILIYIRLDVRANDTIFNVEIATKLSKGKPHGTREETYNDCKLSTVHMCLILHRLAVVAVADFPEDDWGHRYWVGMQCLR